MKGGHGSIRGPAMPLYPSVHKVWSVHDCAVSDEREASSVGDGSAGGLEAGVAWPLLDPAAVGEIAAFGSPVAVEAGQMLYRAGGDPPNFFVVLDGEVEIVREGDDEVVVRGSWSRSVRGRVESPDGPAAIPERPGEPCRPGVECAARAVPAAPRHQAGGVRHDLSGLGGPPGIAVEGRRGGRYPADRVPISRPRRSPCAPSPAEPACRTPGSTSRTSTMFVCT